jgi:adenylate kinase
VGTSAGCQVILIGPPGAGKGTQATLLREEVSKETPLGLEAKRLMDKGQLVPDGLILGLVKDRVSRRDCEKGFIMDGFPRSIPQAEGLESYSREHCWHLKVVSLVVPVEELVERLSGRRTCRACGAMFHTVFDPPKGKGKCDRCGGELYQRDDDREEIITARLEVYRRDTAPLLEFYSSRGLLIHVNGTGSTRQVAQRVTGGLGKAA